MTGTLTALLSIPTALEAFASPIDAVAWDERAAEPKEDASHPRDQGKAPRAVADACRFQRTPVRYVLRSMRSRPSLLDGACWRWPPQARPALE
eukprot:6206828-Pleurochrysis_carterae.AAC.3